MAQIPTNPKLWQLVVLQAKARFVKYPSPAASHWVHRHYEEEGGRFEDSSIQTRRKEIASRQFENAKKAKHGNKDKVEDKGKKGKK